MRIAIDCRPISSPERGEMAGIGHYTLSLVRALLEQDEENRYVLFFDERADKATRAEIIGPHRNAEARVMPLSGYKKVLPYAWSHRVVASAITREKADVFHAPTGSLPMGYKGASVVTAHDLAIYLHPEWFPGGQMFSRRFVVPASLQRARRVIAVSQSTRRDLQRLFGIPAEKIRVIHEGADPPSPDASEDRASSTVPKDPYFLFLGTVEPRKNVESIVAAYARLAERFPRLAESAKLVIAGGRGWKSEAVFQGIERFNKAFGARGPWITYAGYVSAEEKLALMAHCLAFVFPSRYEGFGLPVLEAMRLGKPVITSDVSSLPEIAGRAAMLIDPDRTDELMLAMKYLLENPGAREALGRKALARAHEFRWDRAAGETLEVYEEAFRGGAASHVAAAEPAASQAIIVPGE